MRDNNPKCVIKFNMRKRIWERFTKFYFIGIGGVSMSALAKFLKSFGAEVAGSDIVHSVYTDELEKLGISVNIDG